MTKGRLEAFSDGVIAIIITIMVLELRVPHGTDWSALKTIVPELVLYVLSFVVIGIYWNNHHHLMHAATRIHGGILWANLHLLFWLSLVPFTTRWMGEKRLARLPTAAYGIVLLMAGIAYTILTLTIVQNEGAHSALAKALGRDIKGKFSLVAYVLAVAASFWHPIIAIALYAFVAMIWLIPDPRIESRLER